MKKTPKRSDLIKDFIFYAVLLYVFLFFLDSTNLDFPLKAIIGALVIAGAFVHHDSVEKQG